MDGVNVRVTIGWCTVLKARESEVPSPFLDGHRGATRLSSKSIGDSDGNCVGG